jgi:hypothetical protein
MTTNVSIVVSNYLQEVNTMNSHIFEHIVSEESKDAIHSAEFFIAMAVIISVVGLVFFAAV